MACSVLHNQSEATYSLIKFVHDMTLGWVHITLFALKYTMAARPTTRYVLLSTFALLFVIYFIFLQPRAPDSPAIRAPGHLTDTKNTIPSNLALDDDVLKGNVVMPKLANETAKYVPA
jgi:hypothetical protein